MQAEIWFINAITNKHKYIDGEPTEYVAASFIGEDGKPNRQDKRLALRDLRCLVGHDAWVYGLEISGPFTSRY